MNVIVDGVIFQMQSKGGISRIYQEILPRMCDLDGSIHISLLTERNIMQELPSHMLISHHGIPLVINYLRPWRLWKSIIPKVRDGVIKLKIGPAKSKIWHSTYYTMLEGWKGHSVVTVYDMIHERFPDLFNKQCDDPFRERKKKCILSSKAIICISHTTREDLQNFYGIDSDRVWVAPLAHSQIFRPLINKTDPLLPETTRPFFLYVGDRFHYKNFEGMLEAYSIWPGRKDIDILVVGRPWSNSEEKRLMELGIKDRLHLLTDMADEDLCNLYNRAVAFIYPSLYEGFGIPILEAMSCGCPVIASRIPSTLEVAGECPIYFEPDKTEDLLCAFENVLSEGRDSLRTKRGLAHVKHFSWDRTAAHTLEVYRAVSAQ